MTDPDFARNANPLGKCTAECKVWLPEDADEALTALAWGHKLKKGEYVRNVLMKHLYGEATFMRMQMGGAQSSDIEGTEASR